MNRYLMIICISILSSLSMHATTSKTIFEDQLEPYISQLLDHLFYPHHKHPERTELIQTIAQTTRTQSPAKPVFWDWKKRMYQKMFDQSFIDQQVRAELLSWIKKKAYDYAKQVSTDQTSQKLVEKIAEQLNKKMETPTSLEQGVFSAYVGKSLQIKINQMVHKLLTENAQCDISPSHSTH